jgi:hypothetical protein
MRDIMTALGTGGPIEAASHLDIIPRVATIMPEADIRPENAEQLPVGQDV